LNGAPSGEGEPGPRRHLVIHLPAFRLECRGFASDDPAALVAPEDPLLRLVALTPGALRAGLRCGSPATEARALVPRLALVPHDAALERRARTALLQAFAGLADRGAFAWEDGLVLDLADPVPDGEEAVARRALDRAGARGHLARAGIADDPLAARAIAEWVAPDGGVARIPAGEGARRLAPLPLASLRPDEALLAELAVVGVETVGQWAGLDPDAVAARYGRAAARLHRVARGGTARAIRLGRLAREPDATEGGAPAPRHGGGEPLSALLARLGAQLGEAALFRPMLASAWRPEAAWEPARSAPRAPRRALDPIALQERWEQGWPLPRPSLLLAAPERVEVAVAHDRPVRLWLGQRWQPVVRAVGPERLTGQWWEPAGRLDREYWVVEVEGRGLWVYRDPEAEWWLHGWFD
jgi:nucleotidyltransferase/DNA polymerase involved in DNA repair